LQNLKTCKVGIGSAVPNATTKTLDRGEAKISNVDPSILERFRTWAKMKAESRRLLQEKVDRHVRNYDYPLDRQLHIFTALRTDKMLTKAWNDFKSSSQLSSVFSPIQIMYYKQSIFSLALIALMFIMFLKFA
jgi:hypothetical protein